MQISERRFYELIFSAVGVELIIGNKKTLLMHQIVLYLLIEEHFSLVKTRVFAHRLIATPHAPPDDCIDLVDKHTDKNFEQRQSGYVYICRLIDFISCGAQTAQHFYK